MAPMPSQEVVTFTTLVLKRIFGHRLVDNAVADVLEHWEGGAGGAGVAGGTGGARGGAFGLGTSAHAPCEVRAMHAHRGPGTSTAPLPPPTHTPMHPQIHTHIRL